MKYTHAHNGARREGEMVSKTQTHHDSTSKVSCDLVCERIHTAHNGHPIIGQNKMKHSYVRKKHTIKHMFTSCFWRCVFLKNFFLFAKPKDR